MKSIALVPLLLTTACKGFDDSPPPTSWLDLVNRYLPWVIFGFVMWALSK